MSKINWLEVFGWQEQELQDLRFAAYSYLKQGKYEIATTFFDALAVLNPTHAYDLRTLGALYLQMGNNLLALNYTEQALKIDPNHSRTLLNRTKALISLGYKRQALTSAKQLVYDPDPYVANQASALVLAYE